jgi:hypothetical protein
LEGKFPDFEAQKRVFIKVTEEIRKLVHFSLKKIV